MIVLDELVRDSGFGQATAAIGFREEATAVPELLRLDQQDLSERKGGDRRCHVLHTMLQCLP